MKSTIEAKLVSELIDSHAQLRGSIGAATQDHTTVDRLAKMVETLAKTVETLLKETQARTDGPFRHAVRQAYGDDVARKVPREIASGGVKADANPIMTHDENYRSVPVA